MEKRLFQLLAVYGIIILLMLFNNRKATQQLKDQHVGAKMEPCF